MAKQTTKAKAKEPVNNGNAEAVKPAVPAQPPQPTLCLNMAQVDAIINSLGEMPAKHSAQLLNFFMTQKNVSLASHRKAVEEANALKAKSVQEVVAEQVN